MSVRDRVVKQEKIQINIEFGRYWRVFVDSLPDILKSPSQLLTFGLASLNVFIEFSLFAILTAQTAHVLSGVQKRYINLRHLLMKWVILIGAIQLASYVKMHTSHDELFNLLCNSFLLLFVTPSKFIKNLHLKYFSFSERKKYDDSEEDPASYEMSLTTRMLVSLTLFFLNSSRFMITFVPLAHRKRIQEAMKGVNMVIVEEKYFWKIYESAWSNVAPPPVLQQSTAPPTPKLNLLKNSSLTKENSQKDVGKSSLQLGRATSSSNILKSKVGEYIEIVYNGLTGGSRKFSFYRDVELVYNIDTSELTLVSDQDNKSAEYILSEIAMVEDNNNMLQLTCEGQQESIFVRFKVKKQMETFINSINIEE